MALMKKFYKITDMVSRYLVMMKIQIYQIVLCPKSGFAFKLKEK
jgi:hypothetical protein